MTDHERAAWAIKFLKSEKDAILTALHKTGQANRFWRTKTAIENLGLIKRFEVETSYEQLPSWCKEES